ncbi:MAG: dockerin type I repeat-containing protein [Muribaculaceae bacterium]|nr:dockerin type I repeat-containing protein [Muribaculaceae bacterium]
MKKLFHVLTLLLVSGAIDAQAANELFINDFSIKAGDTITVPVLLDNPDTDFAAFQFDLYMPSGLNVVDGGFRLGERASSSHQLMTKVNGDHITVMVFSFPATIFSGQSGEVLTIDVVAADDFDGQATINVKNIALTTADAHEYSCPDIAVTVTAEGFIVLGNEFYMKDFEIAPGTTLHVPVVLDNHASAIAGFQFDMYLPEGISANVGSFTLSDRKAETHQLVANKNGDYWSVVAFAFPTADFSGDSGDIMYIDFTASKSFTGSAVISFRNVMLSTSDAHESPVEDFDVNVTANGVYVPTDRLTIDDFAIKPGKKKIMPVLLENEVTQYCSFSFEMSVPQGLSVAEDAFTLTGRAPNHNLIVTPLDDDTYKVEVKGKNGQLLTDTEGPVLDIEVAADRTFEGQAVINVSNVRLIESNSDVTTLEDFDVTVTADGVFVPENLFYINDFEITPGQTLQVPVIMDNEATPVAAFQLKLEMPTGLTVSPQGVSLSNRKSETHQVVANVNGSTLSIAAFSFPPVNFSGNTGEVMFINVIASRDFSGTAVIHATDVVLTSADEVETVIDNFDVDVTANGVYVPSDNLTINDFAIAPGRSVQVPVVLTNENVEVNAVEFDIEVPQMLTVSNQARLGERANGHVVTITQQGDLIHIVELSNPLAAFTGDNGNIMYLKVRASREFVSSKVINVKNVVLKTGGGDITIDDFAVVVTASGPYVPVDTLYIDDFSIDSGKTLSVPVIMDNEITNVAALQFDIAMPTELSIPQAGNGDYSITLTERMSDNHYVIANSKDNGDIRVVAVSFPPADFSGNSGSVMNIDIQAIENFTGTTEFIVKNVVMTTTDAHTEISVPDFVVVVTVVKGTNHVIGDVNCDGVVTSADITALYNYLLNSDETFIATSDVNGDGAITSADVTMVYSILMGN